MFEYHKKQDKYLFLKKNHSQTQKIEECYSPSGWLYAQKRYELPLTNEILFMSEDTILKDRCSRRSVREGKFQLLVPATSWGTSNENRPRVKYDAVRTLPVLLIQKIS